MTATAAPIYFEPFDIACRSTLFETYERLHAEAPVYQTPSGWWALTRLDDVRRLYTETSTFSNRLNGNDTMRPLVDFGNPSVPARLRSVFDTMMLDAQELMSAAVIVGADPPVHTRMRRSVNKAFTRARIQALHGFIQEEVDRCLADIRVANEFDVNNDLATEIPLSVMTRLFGLDRADEAEFRHWAFALASQLDAGHDHGSDAWLERHYRLISDFAEYFVPIIEERKRHPGPDLISDVVAGEDGILNASEAVLFIFTLLGAGIETTSNLMGNVVTALMRRPAQLQMVVENPDLVDDAIEESLRFDSPFQFTFREATAEVEVSGVTIPAGGRILNMIGAANRDPAHFQNPAVFDITRKAPHVGFGHGVHFCLGAALARLESGVAVRALVPHLQDFDLVEDEVAPRESLLIWGHTSIPLHRRCPAFGVDGPLTPI
jgi:cytochrome P450